VDIGGARTKGTGQLTPSGTRTLGAPRGQHPDGILLVGVLRAVAINILADLRALSRIGRGDKLLKPTWKVCIEQVLLGLFEPLLDMTTFNAFED
jgi:hypothetical protein